MKILFLQNKGRTYGGVWQVNKTVGEALIKDGYDVTVISIRENKGSYEPNYDKRMHVETLNKNDLWETYSWREIISELKKLRILLCIKKAKHRLHNNKTLNDDKKRLSEYIDKLKPDYIVASHYQLLDMIPKNYLSVTYFEQHCSFKESWSHKKTRKTLIKYKDKVKYIWLCNNTLNEAIKHGLNNGTYIYNAVRFETNKIASVVNNKKLVAIARINKQKRIDKMVEYVEEIFKDSKYHDWKLEIYGDGDEYEKIEKLITSPQIKLMGPTNNPMEVLLSSSISLNTSDYEGFALTILEANECGVPTITLDFGESANEEVKNGINGFVAKDKDDFIEKVKMLMNDDSLLDEMSKNAKEINQSFRIKNIVKVWEGLFNNEKK